MAKAQIAPSRAVSVTVTSAGLTALTRLVANAEAADCHVRAGSEDTLISGSAAQLAAAGYRGTFPKERGGWHPTGYASIRGETIRHEWHDLFKWRIPLLEHERAPRLAEIIAAEGPEDPSRLIPGWLREDRRRLACQMAAKLAERRGDKLARALWMLLSTKDYSVSAGQVALEESKRCSRVR